MSNDVEVGFQGTGLVDLVDGSHLGWKKISNDVEVALQGTGLVVLVLGPTWVGQSFDASALPAAARALRGREPPPLLPRSLVRILPLSSSDILVLISNCLYKHPRRFGARPHL